VVWRHARGVIGRRADFRTGSGLASHLRRSWGFNVTAAEEATYTGAIFPATAATASIRSLAARGASSAVMRTSGRIRAGWNPRLRFPEQYLKPGSYVYAVRLRASMNPRRSSVLVSRPFSVR
jgi:hypothetical protein